MSLNVALSSAVSSLIVLEKQMGVASNNVSNANVQGYSTETEQVAENIYGGIGSGVTDLGTTSNVDKYMLSAVVQGQTSSAQATTYNNLYQELQTALGQITNSTTGGNDIASQISTVQSDLSTLATTPSNTAQRTQVVSDLDNLLSNMRSVSSQIQSIRSSANTQIGTSVTDANTQLTTIASLNKQIESAQALGQTTAGYEDQRNTALQNLSQDVGVSYYVDSTGAMQVFTTTGQPLVSSNVAHQLSFTANSISASSTYPSAAIGGIMLGNTDITDQITSGTIASLVQMRDTELPNAQNSLNALAQSLSSAVNGAYNLGSTVPPPIQLSSPATMGFNAGNLISVQSGTTIAIATMNSTGAAQTYTTVDLTGALQMGNTGNGAPNVVDMINAALLANNVPETATLTNGQFVLQSTSLTPPGAQAIPGQTVAMTTTSGAISAVMVDTAGVPILDGNGNQVTSAGTNLGAFLHLNDLIANGSSATDIQVNPSILKTPSNLATATVTSTGVGTGDGSIATNLFNILNNATAFDSGTAAGTVAMAATSTPFTASSFTIFGGSAPVSVTVASTDTLATIAANINSNAGTSGVTATVIGSGTSCQIQISSGGSNISFKNGSGNALSALGLSSAPTGYLGSASENFSTYATALISDIAARSDAATTKQTSSATALTALQSNLSSQSGVNVDQQMANITELQNFYSASAKVITTANAMFTALLNAVGS